MLSLALLPCSLAEVDRRLSPPSSGAIFIFTLAAESELTQHLFALRLCSEVELLRRRLGGCWGEDDGVVTPRVDNSPGGGDSMFRQTVGWTYEQHVNYKSHSLYKKHVVNSVNGISIVMY